MPITVINGADSLVNASPIFSASIADGINLQTSGVINGARTKPVTFDGIQSGSASVSAPPGAAIVASAIAQMVETPATMNIDLQRVGSTSARRLADALCTSINMSFSADSEVQVAMNFEGGATSTDTIAAPAAPSALTPVLGKNVTVTGAVTGCVLEADVSVTTSYDKKTCVGSSTPTAAVGALYEAKGTATFMLDLGGSLTEGGDLLFTVGTTGNGFTLAVNNIRLNNTHEISGAGGRMIRTEFTGTAVGAQAAFAFGTIP